MKTSYYLIIGISIITLVSIFFILKEQNKKPYSLEKLFLWIKILYSKHGKWVITNTTYPNMNKIYS